MLKKVSPWGFWSYRCLQSCEFPRGQHQTPNFTILDQLTCAFFTHLATNLAEAGALALSWSKPSQEAPLASAGSRWLPKNPRDRGGCKPGRLGTVWVGWQHLLPLLTPRCASSALGGLPPSHAVPGREEPKDAWRLPFPPETPGISLQLRERGWDSRVPAWAPSARPGAAAAQRALRASAFWASPRPVGAAAPEADGALGHSNGAERPRRR